MRGGVMSAAQRSGWAKGRVAERWPLVELEDQVEVLWSGVDQWASACVLLGDGRRLVGEGEFVLEIHDIAHHVPKRDPGGTAMRPR